MKKLKYHLSMIMRGLVTVMKMERAYIWLTLIIEILSPVSFYVNAYIAAKIIDELVETRRIETLMIYVLIIIGMNMILSLVISGLNHLKSYHENQFFKNKNMYFSEKIMAMDYESIEDRDVHLLLERINMESRSGYNEFYLYTRIGTFVREAINIILATALTFSLFTNSNIPTLSKSIMIVLTVLVIFAHYFTTKKSNKITLDMYGKFASINGLWMFYDNYYNDYNAGKDVRLYGMEEFVVNEQNKMNMTSYNLKIAATKKILKFNVFNTVSTDVLRISTYIFVALACAAGSVSVGSIAMYVSCIIRFIYSFTGIINSVQMLINNNSYLERYFNFLDIPSKMYKGTFPVEKRTDNEFEIEFKNVSFKYPNTESYALKNLSMKIRCGNRMAVVGMNGSGKTTVIKLLCRLYDPTEGEITLNGIDIKKYDYNEYMSLFSVVFQDLKLFSFNLGENVAASDNYDFMKAIKCLNMAGLGDRLKTMPQALETSLYKDFEEDGIEISGGEAQKIALARALYKDAPFIVLDEPTAALDPIAEFEVYLKFNEIVNDKTAIYISHRLSSCRFCDDIAVFHEGELIQRGNHDSLIAEKNGKYYELWNAQAQYYCVTTL